MAPDFGRANRQQIDADLGTATEVLLSRDRKRLEKKLQTMDQRYAEADRPGAVEASARDVREQIVRLRAERQGQVALGVAVAAAIAGGASAVAAFAKGDPEPTRTVTVVVKEPVPVSGGLRIKGLVRTK